MYGFSSDMTPPFHMTLQTLWRPLYRCTRGAAVRWALEGSTEVKVPAPVGFSALKEQSGDLKGLWAGAVSWEHAEAHGQLTDWLLNCLWKPAWCGLPGGVQRTQCIWSDVLFRMPQWVAPLRARSVVGF